MLVSGAKDIPSCWILMDIDHIDHVLQLPVEWSMNNNMCGGQFVMMVVNLNEVRN